MPRFVAKLASGPIHYGWVVAGVAFFTLLVAAGVRNAPTVLLVPLEHEFGWSATTVSLPISIGLLLYGLVGPFSAGLIDRFGFRAVMLSALFLMTLGFGLTPLVARPWQLLLLWGVLTGTGTGLAAMVMGALVAARWFFARRGLVVGLLTASAAAGQLVFVKPLDVLSSVLGWRSAVLVACILPVIMVAIVALLMRDHPEDLGLAPYGETGPPRERTAPLANPMGAVLAALGRAVRSRDFWLLSASFFVCGGSTIGLVGTHFIAACFDHGIARGTAATLFVAMGVCNIVGTMASGWLSDRFDSRYLLFSYYFLRGLSLLFLPTAFDFSIWGLALFGLFYGLDWIATVPPTVQLTANIFGARQVGMIYGWITVVHQLGSSLAASGAALVRDWRGDYSGAFLVAGALCLGAALLVLRVGTASRDATRLVTAEAEG